MNTPKPGKVERFGATIDRGIGRAYTGYANMSPSAKALTLGAGAGAIAGIANRKQHEDEGVLSSAAKGALTGAGAAGLAEAATRRFRKTAQAFADELRKIAAADDNYSSLVLEHPEKGRMVMLHHNEHGHVGTARIGRDGAISHYSLDHEDHRKAFDHQLRKVKAGERMREHVRI